jgi:hypothetical protein
MLEEEDVVLGSSCGDNDIGTSKMKVPGVQDVPSTNPVDCKTFERPPYTKLKGWFYLVQYV